MDASANEHGFNELFGFEAAFYALPDPVFIYNHSQRSILKANTEAIKRYGFSEEELRESGPWLIEEPYSEDAFEAIIGDLKKVGETVYRTTHRAKDGSTFLAEVHVTYRKFGESDIFVAVCRELTERIESENRLEKAETHYRAIFENSVNLVCVADLVEKTFLEVNLGFERLLGYTKEEMLARPFTDFIHPDDLGATEELLEEKLLHGLSQTSFKNRYIAKDGRHVWLDWSVQTLPDNRTAYAVGHDISEQRWNEEKLKEQNARLRMHVEQTVLGVIEWDLDFRVKEWNKAAEAIFGYTRKEAVGRGSDFLLPEQGADEVGDVWEQLVNNQGGQRSVNLNVKKGGEMLICEWINTSLIDGTGKVIGVASLAIDVTQAEKRKLELEKAKEAAEKANKAKSEFLSMMSHELRTPLNSIVGPCDLLRVRTNDEESIELLDIMQSSSAHLLDLINSILDLAKIESGVVEVELEEISIKRFFEGKLSALRISAEERGLGFHASYAIEEGAELVSDRRLLTQVLFNVVGNAIKYTARGRVDIRVFVEADLFCIEVKDTGVGISEEMQGRLFEPFRQERLSLSHEQEGTGLGLSITKSILAKLGGTLSVSSAIGQGSTFSIRLPRLTEIPVREEASVEEMNTVAGAGGDSRKVLLVEDEPNNQRVTGEMLKVAGYDYALATGGEESIELYRKGRYDIVLMDIRMPGMSGLEAGAKLRKLAGDRPICIIAQTAYGLKDQKDSLLDEGMDDYLSKPISLASLKKALGDAEARLQQAELTDGGDG